MKYKVKKQLEIRSEPAFERGESYGLLKPGFVFDVVEELKGERLENIDKWLKDKNGYFYWKGGVEELKESKEEIATSKYTTSDYWWHKSFKINDLWSEGLSGKGVKVAILDSGLSLPHPDLVTDNDVLNDITGSESGIKDWSGHGTHITGIIKASNNGFGIKGIAFNSEIYFAKVSHDIYGDSQENLEKALAWAVEQKVDIINVSRGRTQGSSELERLIYLAHQNNILTVCAAGNQSRTATSILFPARYSQTLSVGGTSQNNRPLTNSIDLTSTDIFAPGDGILSTDLNNDYKERSGSSQATAYISGVAALLIEHLRSLKKTYNVDDLRQILLENADALDFGKVINPINSLKAIS